MEKILKIQDVLNEKIFPSVAINHNGIFLFINNVFETSFGWTKEDLIGDVISKIIPPYMRVAHNFGFSRFLSTESPKIMNKPLTIPLYCKDESIINTEQIIFGEKIKDVWQFGAIIKIQ